MMIQQTIDIPASFAPGGRRRLTINVPREVPEGPVILTFMPVGQYAPDAAFPSKAENSARAWDTGYLDRKAREARDLEIINRNAERLNREALDVLSYQELDF